MILPDAVVFGLVWLCFLAGVVCLAVAILRLGRADLTSDAEREDLAQGSWWTRDFRRRRVPSSAALTAEGRRLRRRGVWWLGAAATCFFLAFFALRFR